MFTRAVIAMGTAAVLVVMMAGNPVTSAPDAWSASVRFTNQVASSPVSGGGYPVPPGATAPEPGTCRPGDYNSNRSESWIAVKPGTEDLVGASKFFFETYSTFYDFHLGSYSIRNGKPITNNQVQGYDCISTGTQAMPPSWTNNTDPNVDFDTKGRVYQVTLPFNAYWVNLHPNSNIDISYSDDMGRTWVKGNGGEPLEHASNWSSLSFGRVEDKQWVAVNHNPNPPFQDHVYAAWAVFNGFSVEINVAVSRDRGQTFSKAVRLNPPQTTGPATTFVYPAIDAAGTVYMAFAGFFPPPSLSPVTLWVTRSTDDGVTWSPFVQVATVGALTTCCLPNTTFRDGITESFAASPTYPGHLYMAYEEWDGTQMDVKFTQSTNGGLKWSTPVVVNDNSDETGVPTDQFQPSVAAGPGGAVAVAFYDRRQACPNDDSVAPGHAGIPNFCIDVSLQAYKDSGSGAVPFDGIGNVRITKFTWDPQQPIQHVDGIGQIACPRHSDPCPVSFIGDYFGLAISAKNIYALFVSTHYPSGVTADEGGPVYYQQQVLATVPRSAIGSGF